MPKASVADLEQMYTGSLCVHKNKPYYIISIGRDRKAFVRNLLTQREEYLPIDEDNFSAPTQRLGFVNAKESCVYAHRIPIRRYKVGLSADNFKVKTLGVKYPHGGVQTAAYISTLTTIELADCIMGKYPTLPEAFAKCNSGYTACAFDRQFAVDSATRIWYKDTKVGSLDTERPKGIENIVFLADYKHLSTLLGNKHESILQNSRAE